MSKIPSPERPRSKVLDHIPQFYFREAAETFDRAVSQFGICREALLRIAGVKFRLRFVGEMATLIIPSLAHHLCTDDAPVDWTINCWDDAATGSMLPELVPLIRTNHTRDCLYSASNTRFRAFYLEWMETFSYIDRQEGEAYCCYLNAANLPMYEKAAPMRPIFNAAFNLRGRQIVHAAAFGNPRGSLLLAGAARSGKSTLAVQALFNGMDYQSDDLCVISDENPPRSWILYNIAKLREDSLTRVNADVPLIPFVEGTEKKLFFHVDQALPHRILPEAPIKALVLPSITNEPISRLTPATHLDAVRGLVPWSLGEVPSSDKLGTKIMLKAISQLPAYTLHLGNDVKQTISLLRTLINET